MRTSFPVEKGHKFSPWIGSHLPKFFNASHKIKQYKESEDRFKILFFFFFTNILNVTRFEIQFFKHVFILKAEWQKQRNKKKFFPYADSFSLNGPQQPKVAQTKVRNLKSHQTPLCGWQGPKHSLHLRLPAQAF